MVIRIINGRVARMIQWGVISGWMWNIEAGFAGHWSGSLLCIMLSLRFVFCNIIDLQCTRWIFSMHISVPFCRWKSILYCYVMIYSVIIVLWKWTKILELMVNVAGFYYMQGWNLILLRWTIASEHHHSFTTMMLLWVCLKTYHASPAMTDGFPHKRGWYVLPKKLPWSKREED